MNCPACGNPVEPTDTFCASCGRATAPNAAEQPTAVLPTQQMPSAHVAGPQPPAPYPPPGTYAPQQAGYPPPSTYQPAAAAAPTRASSGPNIALIVGVVLGGIALLAVATAVIVFAVMPRLKSGPEPTPVPTQTQAPAPAAPPVAEIPAGVYSEALEAARAEVPDDHVIELAEETDRRKVYWAGPPNSEWDAVIVVDKVEQGWKVTETSPFNASAPEGDADSQPGADTAAAEDVVKQFLDAIKNDKPDQAQRLTIAPFRNDPASAQYSNGEFKSYTIDRTEPESDGTFWIYTTQTWSYGTEKWRYDVVPTEAGLRIRNLEYVEK